MAFEVADDPVDLEPRELCGERGAGVADHLLGHVDGDVAPQRAGVRQGAEQEPALGRRAGTELDELDGARQGGDIARALDQDRALDARGVVLRQRADLVEQLGAALVVEMLGRKLLEGAREPVEHVLAEGALVALGQI